MRPRGLRLARFLLLMGLTMTWPFFDLELRQRTRGSWLNGHVPSKHWPIISAIGIIVAIHKAEWAALPLSFFDAKPRQELFDQAAANLASPPAHCAYVERGSEKDVAGHYHGLG